jgi:cysteinylglycine-S-conjugate dipeptidase
VKGATPWRAAMDPVAIGRAMERAGPGDLETLHELVRIPSVSGSGVAPGPLRACAERVGSLAASAGLENVELVEVEGSPPYVLADWLHAPSAPTVLLYAHYDVQPAGSEREWSSPPFEPVIRDGRLYGRGASDDKAGVVLHFAAVAAWLQAAGRLPLNVRVMVEGEEEHGSRHATAFIDRFAQRLACDTLVVADSMNMATGVPSVTHSLRGGLTITLTLRSAEAPLHSGIWGGIAPDPIQAMAKVVATMTGADGHIAVPGFADDLDIPPDPTGPSLLHEDEVRRRSRLLPGTDFVGDPSTSAEVRLWHLPCLTVRGLDAPSVDGSPNAIQDSARARLNIRLGPGQDPMRAARVLEGHLRAAVPWGLAAEVEVGPAYRAWYEPQTGPVIAAAARALGRAYGAEPTFIGLGASVPFLSAFTERFPDVRAVLTGVEDPLSGAHGPDESLDLADWRRAIFGEVLLLSELADVTGSTSADA